MFCPNCGTELEEGSIFCGNCGTRIVSEAATTTAVSSKPIFSFKIGKMDFSIIKENIDIFACVFAVIAFISLFLPFFTCSVNLFGMKKKESFSCFSATTSDAVIITIILLLFIASCVFNKKLLNRILGYANLGLVLIKAISLGSDLSKIKNELGDFGSAIKAYPNVGFYFLIISSVVIAFSWLIKSKLLVKLKK